MTKASSKIGFVVYPPSPKPDPRPSPDVNRSRRPYIAYDPQRHYNPKTSPCRFHRHCLERKSEQELATVGVAAGAASPSAAELKGASSKPTPKSKTSTKRNSAPGWLLMVVVVVVVVVFLFFLFCFFVFLSPEWTWNLTNSCTNIRHR